jgi:hypothetical protein
MTATTTLDLAQWVPALAQEIHADDYSPNFDLITHLECQQEAKRLGIKWGKTMEAKDVDAIRDAHRARYADRRKRAARKANLRGGK